MKQDRRENRAGTTVRGTPRRRERIAQEAYYNAERRGFAPGGEIDDWLAAEQRVDTEAPAPFVPAPPPLNINVRDEIQGRERPDPLDAGLPDEPDPRVERRRRTRAA